MYLAFLRPSPLVWLKLLSKNPLLKMYIRPKCQSFKNYSTVEFYHCKMFEEFTPLKQRSEDWLITVVLTITLARAPNLSEQQMVYIGYIYALSQHIYKLSNTMRIARRLLSCQFSCVHQFVVTKLIHILLKNSFTLSFVPMIFIRMLYQPDFVITSKNVFQVWLFIFISRPCVL